ncbi:unconventional myosin-IXb isoform X4 [Leptonychotes weddellii]|uniref:Unconventional myosin-IXb isoform X4 n=1 Tax=Leptonychotes weddellii TaxID=9713 RepID=A0A7F8Q0Q0_LEPWE|nr:unconventional myosin-IXb isoform X4 [Leptonychotes weddellii]
MSSYGFPCPVSVLMPASDLGPLPLSGLPAQDLSLFPQTSLNKLLEALGKAEPFFIRCIRSNAEKKELCFDDELVLQQLRYTGMLETVRIRRSGYSAKYTFQDFTEQFQVLLPKNTQPCREVISALLEKMDVDKRNYQIGKTKVFLKETERQALQETLHREVVRKILLLQSWFRMVLERRHFLQMRQAAITIQACWRSYHVRRALERTQAAVYVQAAWRGYRQRVAYQRRRQSIIRLQSLCRGHLQRKRERRISLSTSDVSKLLPSPSQTKMQPSLETVDGEPSTKKPAVQKKKSGDTSVSSDSGLSPGHQADSKSTFKRLFLHKNKDKKSSLEGVEETENTAPGLTVLEAATTKKNLEASSHQHRHPAGEKHAKEPGGKGKKNRNLKIGKITVSEKWRESVFRKITNANELKYLDEFLLNKINDLRSQKTPIESLFIEATEKFRSNLKTMYSVPNGKIHVGYKDLMENYQIVVNNLAAERGEKDTNLVLNLFQSLLDEFTRGHTKNDFEPPKQSKAQKKKRKQDRAVQQHNGHVFVSYQVSIPQSCEQCLSYIWLMDKALLCSVCKMTCHKKCVHKIQTYCSYTCGIKSEPGAEPGHFGVCVDSLTSDKASVPIVLEKLLEHVEMHGLYTEGLYRKSGAANRTRELRQALQTDPAAVKLENFPIHAITGVLKQWLRELPEPLMTFAQYGDFLRAVELPEKQEQLGAIYAVLEHLPEANHNSLERLIFHLVKVALLEDVNRMSPSALAIIFAPCLLRCPDNSDPLTSMKDVLKVTTCVEMLIKEQMRKYKVKMEEINQLEAAESIAFRRLSLLRQNTPWPLKLGFSSPYEGVLNKSPKSRASSVGGPEELGVLPEEEVPSGDEDREKEILIERIQCIKEEKQVSLSPSCPRLCHPAPIPRPLCVADPAVRGG